MGDGEVQEEGTHHQLLSDPDSKYSRMWKDFLRTREENENMYS